MNSSPVDALCRWANEHKEQLLLRGIILEYMESPDGAARSARLDFESDVSIGRVTVWDAGFCDIEVLDVDSGAQQFYQHHGEVTDAQVAVLLEALVGQMQ